MKKHLILAPMYALPMLLAYWAGALMARADAVRAAPLIVLGIVLVAAAYGRGLHLEQRNDDLEPYAPTPEWPKRLPRWARDAVPPLTPPPLRRGELGEVWQEPVVELSKFRLMRRVEWPEHVPRLRPYNDVDGEEVTETDSEPAAG